MLFTLPWKCASCPPLWCSMLALQCHGHTTLLTRVLHQPSIQSQGTEGRPSIWLYSCVITRLVGFYSHITHPMMIEITNLTQPIRNIHLILYKYCCRFIALGWMFLLLVGSPTICVPHLEIKSVLPGLLAYTMESVGNTRANTGQRWSILVPSGLFRTAVQKGSTLVFNGLYRAVGRVWPV